MSAIDKCSLPNRNILMQPIHMQLSQKLKRFSQYFSTFSKFRVNFEHFRKKMTLIAYLYQRLRPAKNVIAYMFKKYRFRLPFRGEYGKRVATLFKFERQHLRPIY